MVQNGGRREQQNENGHWTAKSNKTASKIGGAANFFSVRVVDTWNAIPDKIKTAKNPRQFKRLYKAHRCSLDGE
jgi:hypothetical protein